MLSLQQVSLVCDGVTIVADLDFSLPAGSITVVLGANGAGKTSMVRMLAGEVTPSKGEMLYRERPLRSLDAMERARRLAVLPQHSSLDFPFTVEEVVAMGRIPHYTPRTRNGEIVSELLDRMHLDALRGRIYTTLSGGERQRVQIARVLCQVWEDVGGASILFDEPTAPLDLAHQFHFLRLMQELAGTGAGILLVMHDINLAARFADTVVLLRGGEMVARGTVESVITRENIRLAYDVDVDIVLAAGNTPLIYIAGPDS